LAAWNTDWAWGLPLIVLNVFINVLGLGMNQRHSAWAVVLGMNQRHSAWAVVLGRET
jgi:hypothetical protein